MKTATAFKDSDLQRAYERDGYVIVRVQDGRLVEQARRAYRLPTVDAALGFQSSLQVRDRAFRAASAEGLAPLGQHLIEAWLDGYEIISSSYLCKRPGASSRVWPHQDWTFCDESSSATFNIWCPLVDVDRTNGALHVLTGSHRLGPTIRGTLTPFPYEAVLDELTFERLEYLPMKVGEALIYDMRLVHGSPPNTASELRLAAGFAVKPAGAQTVHYFQNPASGRLEKYVVGKAFWMQYVFGENRMPAGARFLGYQDEYVCPRFTLADVTLLFTTRHVTSVAERIARAKSR